jgi:hypothetical protein
MPGDAEMMAVAARVVDDHTARPKCLGHARDCLHS